MQLMVVGMHRSGTSMLARLLNLAGAYFGPEGMETGLSKENRKGFWERRDVRALNDYVLNSVGCDWNRISQFRIEHVPESVVAEFEKRAAKIVLAMDANRPWFIKEPRLCLLLPLWRRVLETPVCIYIVRHPVEVAASLMTRNQMPIPVGLALWQRYNRDARSGMAGLTRIDVLHRDLMEDPYRTINAVRDQLAGMGAQGLRPPSRLEIENFVDDELYRERQSDPKLSPFMGADQVVAFERWLQGDGSDLVVGQTPACEEGALKEYESTLHALASPPAARTVKGDPPMGLVAESGGDMSVCKERQKKNACAGNTSGQSEIRKGGADVCACCVIEGRSVDQLSQLLNEQRVAAESLQRRLVSMEEECLRNKMALEEVSSAIVLRDARIEQLEDTLGKERACGMELQQRLDLEIDSLARVRAERDSCMRERFEETEKLTSMLFVVERKYARAMRSVQATQSKTEDSPGEGQKNAVGGDEPQSGSTPTPEKGGGDRAEKVLDLPEAATAIEAQSWDADVNEPSVRLLDMLGKKRVGLSAILDKLKVRYRTPGKASPVTDEKPAFVEEHKLLSSSDLFDARWYLERNPDVAASGRDPILHYLENGAAEGRDPSSRFSTRGYLRENLDVLWGGVNPLIHFIKYGMKEGRSQIPVVLSASSNRRDRK